MNHFLVPIDYSENSINAFRFALQLAELVSGTITSLHVVPDGTFSKLPNGSYDISHDIYQQYMAKSVKVLDSLISKNHSGVAVSHTFAQGRVVDNILDTARKYEADVIVMGTKGASGFREVIFGSITAKTIELAELPVMAIPEDAVFGGLAQIAYSTNFRLEEVDTMVRVLQFAELIKARLHMVHVNLPHTSYAYDKMEELKESLQNGRDIEFHIVEDIDVVQGLARYVREQKIEMLVMLTEPRTFLARLFDRSYTGQMAYYTETPLLVFK